MPFKKAKRTLDKATPGVEDITNTLEAYSNLVGWIGHSIKPTVMGDWEYANETIGLAIGNLNMLSDDGAITEDTFQEGMDRLKTRRDLIQRKEKEEVFRKIAGFIDVFSSKIVKDLARYCRSPNAVGIDRTVTE